MTVDRARQNILAQIVYESARLWKERNPEALKQGWVQLDQWNFENNRKSRLVRDNTGKAYRQTINADGSQNLWREREFDDIKQKAKSPYKRSVT